MNKLQQTLLPIKLEKSEERLTSLAGLIVVEELAQAKGLWRRVEELPSRPWNRSSPVVSSHVRGSSRKNCKTRSKSCRPASDLPSGSAELPLFLQLGRKMSTSSLFFRHSALSRCRV